MKHLKIALGLLFALAISQNGLYGQNLYSSASQPILLETAAELALNSQKIDDTAVSDVTKFIQENIDFPFEELQFINEVKFVVEVDVDESGKVVGRRISDPSDTSFEKSILENLEMLKRVSPITKGGLPIRKTIQIPVTFTL